MGGPKDPGCHYDRVTAAWDYLMGPDLHVGYFKNPLYNLRDATLALTRLMADRAQIRAGMEVLDVGCGTGNPALYLAQKLGCRVTGISTSKVGIEKAYTRAAGAGLEDWVRLHICDATATCYADEAFDIVWVLESSHVIGQKERMLWECVRLLRPGGTLTLCDFVLRREIPFWEVARLRWDLAVLQEVFGRTRLERLDAYTQMFARLKLRTEVQDLSEHVMPTFAHWKRNAELYAADVEPILGRYGLANFVRACDILARLWEDGTFGYLLLVATKPL